MSHERSITVEIDGAWVNLPTAGAGSPNGRKMLSQKEAVHEYMRGTIKPLTGYHTSLDDAVKAAEERSARPHPKWLPGKYK